MRVQPISDHCQHPIASLNRSTQSRLPPPQVSDVVFQGDPFVGEAAGVVHTALEGDVLLGDGSLVAYYNNRWMDNVRHCHPDATEEALRDRPVVCSGFSVGSAGVAPSSTHQGAIVTERLFCTPGYAPIHSANLKRPPERATPPHSAQRQCWRTGRRWSRSSQTATARWENAGSTQGTASRIQGIRSRPTRPSSHHPSHPVYLSPCQPHSADTTSLTSSGARRSARIRALIST